MTSPSFLKYGKKINLEGVEMAKTIFGIDVKEFEKIGKGKEGVVYLGPDNMLLKVYLDPGRCASEYKLLKTMEDSHYFPKVYNCKGSYMLREYVEGTPLVEYIKGNGLSKILANNLIDLSEFFYNTKYLRIDGIDKHVFVLEDESLMVIDPRRKKYKFHKSLLKILERLNQEDIFLNELIENRPDLVYPFYEKLNINFDKYKEKAEEQVEKEIEEETEEEVGKKIKEEIKEKIKEEKKEIENKAIDRSRQGFFKKLSHRFNKKLE